MKKSILFALFAFAVFQWSGDAQDTRRVVINEIAWAGTAAGANDEWIELFNNTDRDIDLSGWVLRWEGKTIHFGPVAEEVENNAQEVRTAVISARGYYLLERTDDTTVNDIEADLIYSGSLRNTGEALMLLDDQGNEVDSANAMVEEGWIAGMAGGDEGVPYATMERINVRAPDRQDNWASNNGQQRNGLDAKSTPLNGTPKARNSAR